VPIVKSTGVTPTERLLANLCERTFLTLWSYPNPFKDNGNELCDLLVVFGDHLFIFFDRESRKFDQAGKDVLQTWQRWKKEAVDKQITTSHGAARYLRNGRGVFLDAKQAAPFPLTIPANPTIHKIIVAHGAKEACAAFSQDNVSGSLAICYGHRPGDPAFPFMVGLDKDDVVHVFDSHNLEILFGTLDTMFDFSSYVVEKERAIARHGAIFYCGEEDLLAHYLRNYDKKSNRYAIGDKRDDVDVLMVEEGAWQSIIQHPDFLRREVANQTSYLWDELIQESCRYALEGTLTGNADLLRGDSALREMAREPRFQRRALSDAIRQAIATFPETAGGARKVSFMPSFYRDVAYVFLQMKPGEKPLSEDHYRGVRQHALSVACAAAKEKHPSLHKVIGIGIDAPKFARAQSEDYLLLDCKEWSGEQATFYREENTHWQFFVTSAATQRRLRTSDFPDRPRPAPKPGRNAPCTCGSGVKSKKCCYRAA
jgi:hypothetical protein